MSRSIHTTYSKDIFGLNKRELEEQFNDPNSDLASLAEKSSIKARVKKERKIHVVSEKCPCTKYKRFSIKMNPSTTKSVNIMISERENLKS